jgi:hypothetical protein
MTAFSRKVADLIGVQEERLERLAGGDLSEVLLLRRPDGRCTVAKGGPAVGTEAAMLRSILGAGVPAPMVEGEHQGVLLLEYVANDGIVSPKAWSTWVPRSGSSTRKGANATAGQSTIGSVPLKWTIAKVATGRVSGPSSG